MRNSLIKAVLFLAAGAASVLSQPFSLDTIITKVSASYEKITSYSADAEIYKYYCT